MSSSKSEFWRRRSRGGKLAAITCAVGMCTFSCASSASAPAGGEIPSELVARGNRLYKEAKYGKAELLYEDAQKSLPESPEINFNLGNVAYRKGDYDSAGEYYSKAAESANASRELRKKALYNLGNCAFKKGEKLLDADLRKALGNFKSATLRYHDVIAKDEYDEARSRGKVFKSDEDAKYNIEVARLRIKDILDKLKQQEERRKEQQKQQEEFIKKLKEAIEEQGEIVNDTGEIQDPKTTRLVPVSQSVDDLTERQTEVKNRTNELAQELQQQIEAAKAQSGQDSGSPAPLDENVLAANDSLKEAEIEQGTALQHLDRRDPSKAKANEEAALRNLQDALARLAKPRQPQPQPGEQPQQNEQARKDQQEQKEGQAEKKKEGEGEDRKKMTPREAQEELAKLRKHASDMRKRNLQEFLRRYPNYRHRRREYEPVDRDW